MTEEQRLFLSDAEEIVERLYRDLDQLRVARSDGRRRRELAAQIFRRVHTLKGSAASLTLKPVSEIAHQFEAVLDGTRLGRLELTGDMLDTFEAAVAAIERALRSTPDEKSAPDLQAIVQHLAAYAEASKTQGVIASGLRMALPADLAGSLSEYDLQHAREAIREGAKLFIVSAGFEIDSFDRNFRKLTKLLGEGGETIATIPGRPAGDDQINFQILYAAEYISSEVLRRASSLGSIKHQEIKVETEPGATKPPRDANHPLTRATDRDYAAVRIELAKLDDLILAASELSRQTTNALAGISGSTQAKAAESATRDLRMRFVAFEERLIKLRLVPAGEVLQRAATRAGRIAVHHLRKEVEFEIRGADVGIEKSLADVIADPLLHLVRNAITHGIETPDQRRAAGKNPTGRVTLEAANQSGRIQVTVTDDGRGIDLDQVVAAAAQQGISSTGLSEDQCLRLIFRPGFSTSRELSDLAGRGIGLDVVDRAMDIAGGEARVATEKGAGTTVAMIVPAALSLAKCVIVRCGEQVYAIDASTVSDSSLASGSRSGADATDSTNLPLVYLTSLVNLATQPTKDHANEGNTFMIWRRPSSSKNAGSGVPGYRIAVDEIVATQETLIRGLGRHAYRWVGICGAAEIFDGPVALVLDLPELIKRGLETGAG
ncbi:MAG: hypothetical protein DMF73_05780 [Acidobacteria bacterium]|nr:MAG: hypothetical protein DMF73_05780 [Acidobacteriota bacterium]